MTTPNNRCAFPSVYEDRTIPGCTRTVVNEGMSLRAYFAGQAMLALGADGIEGRYENWSKFAEYSVMIADALIAELAKAK